MSNIWRTIKTTFEREKLLSVSNIIIMTVTFLILGVFINVIVLSQTALRYLENQAQVTLFFKDSYTEDQILSFKSQIESDERVSDIKYVSKEDALTIFKEINKNEPILLESISSSILPASLEIRTKNIGDLKPLADEYYQNEGVEEIGFHEDVITTFKFWSTIVYIVGFILVFIFFLISYSVVLLTLRTTINSKGTEFEILKLVGASDDYVKKPLIYQGVFYGLVSSGIASLVLIFIGVGLNFWSVLSSGISFGFVAGLFFNPIIFSVVLAFILMLSGFLLGYYGSIRAVKKYLTY